MNPFRHTPSYDTIVLRTFDIGEADRFCIFFTRERGRLSAKAKCVRKTTSRMGGTLLPFHHLAMELAESDSRATVITATDQGDLTSTTAFSQLITIEQGIELLLVLTEEDEPLPEVFDLLHAFLHACHDDTLRPLIPFQLRLLHLLGHLPTHTDDERVARLPSAVTAFLTLCTRTDDLKMLSLLVPADPTLDPFLRSLIDSHLSRPLKSEGIRG